jgi:hypothetical protein
MVSAEWRGTERLSLDRATRHGTAGGSIEHDANDEHRDSEQIADGQRQADPVSIAWRQKEIADEDRCGKRTHHLGDPNFER